MLTQVALHGDTSPLLGKRSAAALEAAAKLEAAVGDMSAGRYRVAVAKCRDAHEVVHDFDGVRGVELELKGARELTKKQRFWLIRHGALSAANAAKHQVRRLQRLSESAAMSRH